MTFECVTISSWSPQHGLQRTRPGCLQFRLTKIQTNKIFINQKKNSKMDFSRFQQPFIADVGSSDFDLWWPWSFDAGVNFTFVPLGQTLCTLFPRPVDSYKRQIHWNSCWAVYGECWNLEILKQVGTIVSVLSASAAVLWVKLNKLQRIFLIYPLPLLELRCPHSKTFFTATMRQLRK